MYQSTSRFCEFCGASNQKSSLFCHACSQSLQRGPASLARVVQPYEGHSDEEPVNALLVKESLAPASEENSVFTESEPQPERYHPARVAPGEKIYPPRRQAGLIARRAALLGGMTLGAVLLYGGLSQAFSGVSVALKNSDDFTRPDFGNGEPMRHGPDHMPRPGRQWDGDPYNQSSAVIFDDTPLAQNVDQPLSRVRVTYGDVINDIQAFYGSQMFPLQGHGGASSGYQADIQITSVDPLVAISGYTGLWSGQEFVASLSFRTLSGKIYGPFGNMDSVTDAVPFVLTAPNGTDVQAFSGIMASAPYAGNDLYLSSLSISAEPFQTF